MVDNVITYNHNTALDSKDLLKLYSDAGWKTYTDDLPDLLEAVSRSLLVITAWDANKLVGLIRVVGDGISIIYLQDLLVLKAYRRKGIATVLVKLVTDHFKGVRQTVLLTDDTPETRSFYSSLDFTACDQGDLVAFIRFR